jgi:creatinine amidohydrolase/Fe(II)-dependent formamide hydrolase-like protein
MAARKRAGAKSGGGSARAKAHAKSGESARKRGADRAAASARARTAARTPARSRADDPLGILTVIDRLEVGPVRVERARLIAPYTVTRGNRSESFDLIYRFGEDVFDPSDPVAQNLASMIAAQVAVNYGLFCREIAFRGPFDEADQSFLSDMIQNTAREIFVKKFLSPNAYLVGPAALLPPVKREAYSRAKLLFDAWSGEPRPAAAERTAGQWRIDRSRHAVLSSGGKDSLLSYGLLREIGRETHPIFVNESGRHWFTALNAYRHLSGVDPKTARVWTNADRLFTWMKRSLPFIRPDFDRVRADYYPIRLWTVAVFLFGALPLLRKRGIGRLVIGNEFDTTRRLSFEEITHYDGLYDQSRYFDNALTRYFARKSWGVSQFSILRPLSELLIQKMLVERYPDLQREQVSCHSARTEGERVLPCGACEKCRRIVSMLVAVGADPSACGYDREQIASALTAFAERGSHTETPGVQHVAFLLEQRGAFPPTGAGAGRVASGAATIGPGGGAITARERPEIAKLRFDPERSPSHGIPNDLRESLYRIFLEHAAGAVKKSGRVWIACDPLRDQTFSGPYPFEAPSASRAAAASSIAAASDGGARAGDGAGADAQPPAARGYLLGELTWHEARARLREVDIALLPVGAIEQHGPHLPLDTDAFDADYLARRVAAACADPKPLVLPLIPYGVSYHHDDFSGTISVTNETLSQLVYEIGVSAARNGVTKLVVINGHGGNTPTLQFAAQMINRDAGIFTCVDTGETSDADISEIAETASDVHAGEVETSTSLAVRPELVKLDKARRFVPRFSSRFLDFSARGSVEWYARTARISPTGVLGDPTKASREKGERFWELMVQRLVEFVEHLKGLSLDEIYQRKY